MKNETFLPINILPNTIHSWRVFLPEFYERKHELEKLLSLSELSRANRFIFDIHRDRFIIARAILRKILSLYMEITPEDIVFEYGDHGKPYLHKNINNIQFNVSHSDDWAVYAISKEAEIGIDVEKIQNPYEENIAKRFFSDQENNELLQLPFSLRMQAFYRIWVKKEAVIKLLGKGLYIPLSVFTVGWSKQNETIMMQNSAIHLYSTLIAPLFPIAIATRIFINSIESWEIERSGYQRIKIDYF
jgi:4'-phosphopantetheinyl transferase